MTDSLTAVIDSLVRAAVAASDSTRAAQADTIPPYARLLDHPLFKFFWPVTWTVITGVIGFFSVRAITRREKQSDRTAEQEQRRTDTALRLKKFLSTAADMLQPLLDRLNAEGAIIIERGVGYPPAENILAYLEEFVSLRPRLDDLKSADVEHEIVLWHKAATANLVEVRDSRVMMPGLYLKTYVTRGDQGLNERFAAIQAGLVADISNARELAARL